MTQAPTPGPLLEVSCAETPLQDLLRRVPKNAVLRWEVPEEGRALWQLGSESSPVGSLMHRAADQLDAFRLAPTAPVEASGSEREKLAVRFHETYERLAPSFGYETRDDTKAFDPTTPNGRLMIAVCGELLAALRPQPSGETREQMMGGGDVIALVDQSRWDCPNAPQLSYANGWNDAVSARPLALGGQHSGGEFTSVTGLWKDQGLSRLERVKAHRSEFGSELKQAVEAVDEETARQAIASKATPARAEAQDEGAAGELAGYFETYRPHVENGRALTVYVPLTLHQIDATIAAIRAHPSPPPAADEDRVR